MLQGLKPDTLEPVVEKTREKVLEVAGLRAENVIAQFQEKAKGKREEAINLVISEIA